MAPVVSITSLPSLVDVNDDPFAPTNDDMAFPNWKLGAVFHLSRVCVLNVELARLALP